MKRFIDQSFQSRRIVATPVLKSSRVLYDNMSVISNDGKISVSMRQVNGVYTAEPFEISTEDLPKGSIGITNEENSEELKLNDHAYDNRVVGILSVQPCVPRK
jgi:hypothetical protein